MSNYKIKIVNENKSQSKLREKTKIKGIKQKRHKMHKKIKLVRKEKRKKTFFVV